MTNEESQSNINAFLAGGGTQDILSKESYGGKLDTKELNKFVSKYGLDSSKVYSALNSTTQASQPTDLLGIRTQIYNDLGIPTAQEEFNKSYKGYMDFQTAQDVQQNQLENQPLNLNVIRGEQAEASRLGGISLAAKARGLDVLQRGLESKLNEAQVQYQIRAQELTDKRNMQIQYAGAGIKLSDSYEQAADKISKYQKKQAVESAFASVFGYIPDKKSSSWMKNKLKKNYKESKKLKDELDRIDLESKQIALGKLKADGAGGIADISSLFGDNVANLQVSGNSGYTSSPNYSYYGIGGTSINSGTKVDNVSGAYKTMA
jgi:hypothetical protein